MRFGFKDSSKSDEELMISLQQGDCEALSSLYKKYGKPLLSYFYKMLWQNEELAQDTLQDLFIKILDKKALFNPKYSFKVWIYAMAYNICKNQYRKEDRAADIVSIHQYNGQAIHVDQGHEYDKSEFKKKLRAALFSLSEDHRTAFIFRYEQEMKIEDIAHVMNCSEGTVKSRLFYAKKKLAECLREFGPQSTQNTKDYGNGKL